LAHSWENPYSYRGFSLAPHYVYRFQQRISPPFAFNPLDRRSDELDARAMNEKPIYVTQPSLPPLEEFLPYLNEIWKTKRLTNAGPYHQQLEKEVAAFLGVEHLALFCNGTIALLTALQTLGVSGEVITTPYSFAATTHSLLWSNLSPVFVDIDSKTLNLDPKRIEEAITDQTSAIMPVHVYGEPCDVDEIQRIANSYDLKVIYDAAHAFGVTKGDRSVLNYGDLSVLSFHATKVFNTFEGGAIVCPDAETKQRIDHLKNFGISDELTVNNPGLNGKMNEVQAAFGLLQLKYIDRALDERSEICQLYRDALADVRGIDVKPEYSSGKSNNGYFPIFVKPEYPLSRDALYEKFRDSGIYTRRYFYPLISDFPMYRNLPSAAASNLPVAKTISDQVICLPIYPGLSREEQALIVSVIAN
jgi:dTDP-4-amino-4,6-dideoxygalactose transaminase